MSFLAPARRVAASLPRQPLLTRNYARMTLIGTLVQDAKLLNENVEGKEPIVALKIATQDPISRAAREAGREPTSSFHDILSFNPNLRPYLSGFRKGSLVHVDADVRMETIKDAEGNFETPKTRLTLREVTKLRNPSSPAE